MIPPANRLAASVIGTPYVSGGKHDLYPLCRGQKHGVISFRCTDMDVESIESVTRPVRTKHIFRQQYLDPAFIGGSPPWKLVCRPTHRYPLRSGRVPSEVVALQCPFHGSGRSGESHALLVAVCAKRILSVGKWRAGHLSSTEPTALNDLKNHPGSTHRYPLRLRIAVTHLGTISHRSHGRSIRIRRRLLRQP